jgi:hypothetical protein
VGTRVTAILAMTLLLGACGGGSNNLASHTPSPSASGQASASPTAPSPSPQPTSRPYGVLVGSQAASTYTISLISVDGKVAASAETGTPPLTTCGTAAAAPFPLPVSTSNSRVYFMDGSGAVNWLAPDGSKSSSPIVKLASTSASQRATFAVSPDDTKMAAVVATYTTTAATTKLYMYDLAAGGSPQLLFSESGGRSLWPVGWHGTNNLVLAVVPSCTQGGGPFCCGMQELHVVDPATATRRFTLGTWATCPIAGPPSPAGAVCVGGPEFTSGKYLNWTGGTVKTVVLNNPAAAFVSPGGGMIAFADATGTEFTIGAARIPDMAACTWIDETHVMSGGDQQHQPRVADVINGGIVPVAATGDCGGRLPGGL